MYRPYLAIDRTLGIGVLSDQHQAGALMWVPGGLLHALVAIALIAPHLRRSAETADA